MQAAVRGGLLTVCLGLAGCGLFGKRASAPGGAERPFLGTAPNGPAATGTTAAPASPSPVNGILAGQVLDRFNRRQPGAFIQVVDLSVPQQGNAAKIEVATDPQGYFTIQGLQPTRHYQLIARSKDGDKVLTGTALAMPPNPRLSIYISDDLTSPTTPAVPGAPAIPGKGAADKKPAAILDPPTKAKPEVSGTATPPPAAAVQPVVPIDPSKVVVEPGGFARIPAPVSLPGPPVESTPPVLPRPPTAPLINPQSPPLAPRNTIGPTSRLPGVAPPVPWCVLVGRRVENFALYDLNGQTWEYRRDHKGRLTLVDFWYSTCPPCLQALPYLVELQRQYGPFGLEVVGIAYEKGKPAEQVQRVQAVRGRYNIPYTTLLGGGPGPCPVQTQLEVHVFPTLFLLDESGQILWRSEGLDGRKRWELETEIRRRLGIRAPGATAAK